MDFNSVTHVSIVFIFLALISNWLLIREVAKEVKVLRADNRRLKQRVNTLASHKLADPLEVS